MSVECALKGLEGVSAAEIHKTDITFEAAEISIMRGYLNSAADSIIMSRKTMRNIKQNLFFAFLTNTHYSDCSLDGGSCIGVQLGSRCFECLAVPMNKFIDIR